MTDAKDLFSYTKVEGIYTHLEGWCHVALCDDCFRVVGITDLPTKKADPSTKYRWSWLKQAKGVCRFCGHVLLTDEVQGLRSWGGITLARACMHHDITWWNPSTWQTGHWEVRDFEKLMEKKDG